MLQNFVANKQQRQEHAAAALFYAKNLSNCATTESVCYKVEIFCCLTLFVPGGGQFAPLSVISI